MTNEQKTAIIALLEDFNYDDVTNQDEPDGPTVWVTCNIRLPKLNLLRAAVGLAPVTEKELRA